MTRVQSPICIAIACGGTGGHLFPGLAVAEQLRQHGCDLMLLISPKEIDQTAAKMVSGMEIVSLPAVGLQTGQRVAFLRSFSRSYSAALKLFRARRPQAALAMGGFTSTAPILAARRLGAPAFLHESNAIPGRANRWLSWFVRRAFIGFPAAANRLHARAVTVTGTPVRSQFVPREAGACRSALGLDQARPVVLVMGGSQGARGINDLIAESLPKLGVGRSEVGAGELQWIHLAGAADVEKVKQAYAVLNLRAVVHPFFGQMELALGAATVAVSRSGASALAELAAMRVPAVLIPFPAATDNHQFHNARAFVESGAARLLEQAHASPELLANEVLDLVKHSEKRRKMQDALAQWHAPKAAEEIASAILAAVGAMGAGTARPLEQRGGESNTGVDPALLSTAAVSSCLRTEGGL